MTPEMMVEHLDGQIQNLLRENEICRARIAELEGDAGYKYGQLQKARARIAELEGDLNIFIDAAKDIAKADTIDRCAQVAIDETLGDEDMSDVGKRIAATIRALKDKP